MYDSTYRLGVKVRQRGTGEGFRSTNPMLVVAGRPAPRPKSQADRGRSFSIGSQMDSLRPSEKSLLRCRWMWRIHACLSRSAPDSNFASRIRYASWRAQIRLCRAMEVSRRASYFFWRAVSESSASRAR